MSSSIIDLIPRSLRKAIGGYWDDTTAQSSSPQISRVIYTSSPITPSRDDDSDLEIVGAQPASRDKNAGKSRKVDAKKVREEPGDEGTLGDRLKRVQREKQQSAEEPAVKKQKTTDLRQFKGKSEHELRLLGDYTTPKEAQPIVIPVNEWDGSRVERHFNGYQTMMGKRPNTKPPGGFRPQNTLNEMRYSQRSSGGAVRKPLATSISGSRNMNPHVPTQFSTKNGSSQEVMERHPKRQKTETVRSPSNSAIPIDVDLTGAAESPSPDEPKLNPATASSKIFSYGWYRPVEILPDDSIQSASRALRGEQSQSASSRGPPSSVMPSSRKNRPRHDGNAAHSSQSSSHGTVFEHRQSCGSHDSQKPNLDHSQTREGQQALAAVAILPIDLGKGGVDKRKKTKADHTSPAGLMGQPVGRHSEERIAQHKFRRNQIVQEDLDFALPQSVTSPSKERRLSKTFERETEPSKQTSYLKAKDRMRAGYAGVNSDDDGELDELANGNAGHQYGLSSPTKARSRRPSASDIKPTLFKSKDKQGLSKSKHATDELEECRRIPLTAFYASSYVDSSGHDLWLKSTPSGSMELWVEGSHVRASGVPVPITLRPNDFLEINHDKECPRIVCGTVINEVTKARVCIAFRHVEDKSWFIGCLSSHSNFKLLQRSRELLDRIFIHQANQIQEVYQKARDRGRDLLMPARTPAKHHDDSRPSDENEQILDEDGVEELAQPKSTARSRMQRAGSPEPSSLSSKARAVRITRQDARADGLTSSPFFEKNQDSVQPSRVTRKRKTPTPPPRWTEVNNPERWKQPVQYPYQGRETVAVEFRDLAKLDEGEFLNDNLIAFALRQIVEKMKPEHRKLVHFFNTFFYTALTKDGRRRSCNYDAVKRWTRKIDLIGLPFVVVPINLDYHWCVAIICNLDQLPRSLAGFESVETAVKDEEQSTLDERTTEPELTEALLYETPHSTRDSSSQDGNSIQSSSVGQASETAASKKSKKKISVGKKFDPYKPTVVALDSLSNVHTAETRILKEYICKEALDKREMEISIAQIQGVNAKAIPQQTNFSDCGLFLIGYVEEFSKNPRRFTERLLRNELDPASEFAHFDASKKREEIRDELLRLYEEQERVRIAAKKAKSTARKTAVKSPEEAPPPKSSPPKSLPPASKPVVVKPKIAFADLPVFASIPEPMESSEEPSLVAAEVLPGDVDDSGDELDYGPARALPKSNRGISSTAVRASTSGQPVRLKAQLLANTPTSIAQKENSEMLDNAADSDPSEEYAGHRQLESNFDGIFNVFDNALLPVGSALQQSGPQSSPPSDSDSSRKSPTKDEYGDDETESESEPDVQSAQGGEDEINIIFSGSGPASSGHGKRRAEVPDSQDRANAAMSFGRSVD